MATARGEGGHILVRPLVDGKDVGFFILDTGCSSLAITPQARPRPRYPQPKPYTPHHLPSTLLPPPSTLKPQTMHSTTPALNPHSSLHLPP